MGGAMSMGALGPLNGNPAERSHGPHRGSVGGGVLGCVAAKPPLEYVSSAGGAGIMPASTSERNAADAEGAAADDVEVLRACCFFGEDCCSEGR